MTSSPLLRTAHLDEAIDVRVRSRRALRYSAGADAEADRPAHVRAGSAVARFGARLAVIQDDASFVAFVEDSGAVTALPLPRGPGGRRLFGDALGNKHHKLDLEACAVVGGALLAFGSGSTPARERICVLDPAGQVDVRDASRLYGALRACVAFAGSELNVEGAVAAGDHVLLASRGNGAPSGDLNPIDAVCSLRTDALLAFLASPSTAAVPSLTDVVAYDLGRTGCARLTFTDLAAFGERIFYVACAEASPDATRDGPVSGVALGELGAAPRYGLVRDERGALLTDKIEGILFEGSDRVLAVIDVDDPERPAELLELSVVGL